MCIRDSRHGGRVQSLVDIASHNASPHQNVSWTVLMNQPCPARKGRVDIREWRQLFPTHRKVRSFQCLYRRRLADHRGNRFSAIPGLLLRKHRLIRERDNHSVAILSRHILRSEDGFNPRMIADERSQVAEVKSRPGMGTANRSQRQCLRWSFIRAKLLGAVNLSLSIQPDQPASNSSCLLYTSRCV